MLISDYCVKMYVDKINELEEKIKDLEEENKVLSSAYQEVKFFLEKITLMK